MEFLLPSVHRNVFWPAYRFQSKAGSARARPVVVSAAPAASPEAWRSQARRPTSTRAVAAVAAVSIPAVSIPAVPRAAACGRAASWRLAFAVIAFSVPGNRAARMPQPPGRYKPLSGPAPLETETTGM